MPQGDRRLENSIRIPGLLGELGVFLGSLTPIPVSTIRALLDNAHRNTNNELHRTDRKPVHTAGGILALGTLESIKAGLLCSVLNSPNLTFTEIYIGLSIAAYAIGLLGSLNKQPPSA